MEKKVKKVKNGIVPLLLFFLVLAIVVFTLHSSIQGTFQELLHTPVEIVFLIFILGICYQMMEGYNIQQLGKIKKLNLTWQEGMAASCYTAFMRVVTFGSGTILSEIWYYHKKKVMMPYAIGLTLCRLIFYKLSLIIWGIVGFIVMGRTLYSQGKSLFYLALIGLIITTLITALLLTLASSIYSQVFLVRLFNRLLKKEKWREKFDDFNLQIYALRDFLMALLKNKSQFITCLFINLIKVIFWLVIPGVFIHPRIFSNELYSFFFLTDFSFLTAGILPAPAGMGSLEFVFMLFFPMFISKGKSVSALILLRFASYFLPFFIGFFVYLRLKKNKIMHTES